MSDPLSIAASVVGLLSTGIKVTQSLVDFYVSYKDCDSDLAGITNKLESLLTTFKTLKDTVSRRNFRPDERDLIRDIESAIQGFNDLTRKLQYECKKFKKTTSNSTEAIRVAGRRMRYPFKKSKLQKLDTNIDQIRRSLSFALEVLQLKTTQGTHSVLESVRLDQISSSLSNWLKAPDNEINHYAAFSKKHSGTGTWLIEDTRFVSWLSEENPCLWLTGFAGSGKSILCSTVIQRYRGSDPAIGIAFFYFTFNDDSKQDDRAMLGALLLQLSKQLQDGHAELARLHASYEIGSPTPLLMLDCLRHLIERFQHVYILLDALDESPRDGSRGYVLAALQAMRKWDLPGLHLFVTSRDERDIHESLNIPTNRQISMQNPGTDNDIARVISSRLNTDPRLQKWLLYRDRIHTTLTERAKGW